MTRRAKARRAGPAALLPVPVLLALAGIHLNGCATTHTLTPLAMEGEPGAQHEQTGAFTPARYATFSVFPLSLVNPGAAQVRSDEVEKPLLFFLRNALESRGYTFVPLGAPVDLLITADASFTFQKDFDPRKPLAPPAVPTALVPPDAAAAALAASARPALAARGWGTLDAGERTRAPLPGYPLPGGRSSRPSSGYYLAMAHVRVLDAGSLSEVWAASGLGVSRTPNLLIHAQVPLWTALDLLPDASTAELVPEGGDIPGLALEVVTNDGASYFPAVLDVERGSPGWLAGVKPYDLLLAVGGEPAKDRPLGEMRARLRGPVDSPVSLTLWRGGEQFNLSLTRVRATRKPGVAAPEAKEPDAAARASRHRIPAATLDQTRLLWIWGLAGAALLFVAGYGLGNL